MKRIRRAVFSRRAIIVALLAALAVKFLWSMTVSAVPFGYDAGMYRLLFLRHAEGWPPFSLAAMPEWTRSHPLGLFAFTSLLVKIGVPADALIGWIWNLFVPTVGCVLAWAVSRKHGARCGVFVLAVFLVSAAQYEGFVAMYWKVMAALLWCTLAFHCIDKRDARWVVFGMLCIATHLQVGMVLGLAVLSACAFAFLSGHRRDGLLLLWTGALTAVLGGLWYLPNYGQAVAPVLKKALDSFGPPAIALSAVIAVCAAAGFFFVRRVKLPAMSPHAAFMALLVGVGVVIVGGGVLTSSLLTAKDVASGSFLSLPTYLELSFPLLILGLAGLFLAVRGGERGSAWQWALVWCVALVFSRFFFYLRFLLLLDFFLLPFAALALDRMWDSRNHVLRNFMFTLLFLQAVFAFFRVTELRPHFSTESVAHIRTAVSAVPEGGSILVLDNMYAPWVLGLAPQAQVIAPGVFISPTYEQWEQFIYGTHEQRAAFLADVHAPAFAYVSDMFLAYYPDDVVHAVLSDECLQPVGNGLFRVECTGR
jgi:hypothetical protein